MANREVSFGANCWAQYTDWPSLLEAGRRADRLGFHSLWTWDHLYPIVGSANGPMFEGYMVLAAWAQATQRARIGLMVGANPFRNPALTVKMATALDHISNGRAYLGIGSAWNDREARAFGIEFGDSPGERLRWLREALPVMRAMLDGGRPSTAGPRYAIKGVRNDPPPLQKHMPLLIGGGGPKVTLRLVARYGDANNIGGGIESVRRKEAILLQHCRDVGRDPAEIERTATVGAVVVRDSHAEAARALERIYAHNGGARSSVGGSARPVGTPEHVAQLFAPYVELGYRHLIVGFPSPYDEETMVRLMSEVAPRLATTLGVAHDSSR